MILKDIFLYPVLTKYDRAITQCFRMQSWGFTYYLTRQLKEEKIVTEGFNRICLIGQEKPINEGYCNTSNSFSIDVPLDLEEYNLTPVAALNDFFCNLFMFGISTCIQTHHLPLSNLLEKIAKFKAANYENKWSHDKKTIKGTSFICEIICELTVSNFSVDFIIWDKKEKVYEQQILNTEPDWIRNSYYLKNKLVITKDKILLKENRGVAVFELRVSSIPILMKKYKSKYLLNKEAAKS